MYAHFTLFKNLDEVHRLLQIHTEMTGKGPGYKHNVGVLNKSAIVLLVACWESFVEDLAETAFSILLTRAKKHDTFEMGVLTEAAKPLKDSPDSREVWKLAGDGWKSVLKEHKAALFERYIGKFNTPRSEPVDCLYRLLLGINAISSNWRWQGMSVETARSKLNRLIELRGSIAHRVAASRKVLKNNVRDHISFINHIAVNTSNAVRSFILESTGKEPWPEFSYAKTKTF